MTTATISYWVDQFRPRALYFGLMGSASVFTFARGLVAAAVLASAEFGLYVTLVAIGIFSTTLISFGRVEGFMKSLPRYWAAGLHNEVRAQADRAAVALTLRGLGASVPLVVLAHFSAGLFTEAAMMALFALATVWCNVYFSAIRATGHVHMLGKAHIIRTVSALLLVPLGATVIGWQGAMAGEFLSALLAALVLRGWLAALKPSPAGADTPAARVVSDTTEKGGIIVFFSLSLVAAPLYFDRLFVGQVYGLAMVGTFGFLLLFQMLNSTLVGIVVQSVGPNLVRLEQEGATLSLQLRQVGFWSLACIGASSFAIAALTVMVMVWPLTDFRTKYDINLEMIVAIAVLSFFRVSEFLDWVFISRNREPAMLAASAAFFVLMVLAALVVVMFKLGFLAFLWLIVLARAVQVAMQLGLLAAGRRGPARSSATP